MVKRTEEEVQFAITCSSARSRGPTVVLQQLLLQLRQRHPVLRRTAAVVVEAHLVQLRTRKRAEELERNPPPPAVQVVAVNPSPEASPAYLQPQVVFGLVGDLSVVVADVALPDQAVDGPLVRVGAVPQHAAVVKAEFVFGIR